MIGVFDSGIGGLTIVKELFKKLPQYQIVYFGDSARMPYGTKSPETITRYACEDTEFLKNQGANLIVIACNTASAVAADKVKEKFSSMPVFEVITPAAEKALKVSKGKKIGVIGTRATISSGVYERKMEVSDTHVKIFPRPAPLLVPLVEEGWIKSDETKRIVKHYVYPLRLKQIDTLILGCTHYPFLKRVIQSKIGRGVKLVDPAEELAETLSGFLAENPEIEHTLDKGTAHKFFFSDITDRTREIASEWLGRKVQLQKISL